MPLDDRRLGHLLSVHLAASLVALGVSVSASTASAEPPPPEVGYDYGEFAQPRGAALGGAVTAFANSLDALYSNPANIAATRVYHFGGAAQFWPVARRSVYGGGIVDSVTSRVAGGLGAQYFLQSPGSLERSGADIRLALGLPVSDRFLIGVAGRYLGLKEDGPGPLGASTASSGLGDRQIVRELSFDAGATLRPAEGLALAAVGRNLANADHGFLPLTAGGGIGFGTEDFTVEADVFGDFRTWDRNTVRAMGGFELLAGDHFPLRLGYRFDQGASSHAVCAGFGYLERAFSTSIAVRQVVVGDPVTAIFLGFEYHLESAVPAASPADF